MEIIRDFGETFRDYAHDLALLRRLHAQGFEPGTIYDIGSSDGIWSSIISRIFPTSKYELFEPLAEVSEEYRQTQATHPSIKKFLSTNRARIHPVALGRSNATCLMTIYPHAVGSTSLELDHVPAETQTLQVPSWRLDDYVAREKLTAPGLLKLDTQGSELEILAGATKLLPVVSAVLCECWLFKGYGSKTPLWIDIANTLAGFGLYLYDTGWSFRRPSDQRAATVDMLFLRHNLAFSPLRGFSTEEL